MDEEANLDAGLNQRGVGRGNDVLVLEAPHLDRNGRAVLAEQLIEGRDLGSGHVVAGPDGDVVLGIVAQDLHDLEVALLLGLLQLFWGL